MFTSHNSNPITASEPLSHRRLEALDILRLLAALAVLLYHFLYRGSIAGGYLAVSYGLTEGPVPLFYFGVPLFFMISGFVIIWSAEGRSGWQFGKSRVIRLYPGHVAAMTLTALVIMVWGTPPFEVSLGQWFANLTMVAPAFGQSFMDGVYWTIVVELIFYFWIALLLLAGILPRYTERVVALWLLIIVVDLLLFQSHAAKLVLLTSYAGCFALGVMAYRIRMHGMTLTRFSLALLAFMLTFTGAERERLVLIDLLGIAPDASSVAGAQLFTCLVFAGAVSLPARLTRQGSRMSKVILAGAGITYPLYLLHQNAGYIFINALSPFVGKWMALGIASVVTILAAWAIWRFVEPVGRILIRHVFRMLERRWRRLFPAPLAPAE